MTEPSSHYTEVRGFPTSSHLYRKVIPTLAKTQPVIALDLPPTNLVGVNFPIQA